MQNTLPWESRLLSLADEAPHHLPVSVNAAQDARLLADAYAACERLTRAHSRTFYLASGLLPEIQRKAVRALYAFCRVSDDIVDHSPQADTMRELATWRERALSVHPPSSDLVALAWADTRMRYGIPLLYAEQLLDGVASDLSKTRYQTFEELAAYAYSVASTVGLMSMYIIGFAGRQAVPYAIKLGVALQITNILRDVGEDWRNGRLYLPQVELDLFGIMETEIASGQVTPQWRRFMQYQIDRLRRLYSEALPGIGLLEREGRMAIAAASDLYAAILNDIEAHDYDVFSRRAHISAFGKLRRIPGIWLRVQALEDLTTWFDE